MIIDFHTHIFSKKLCNNRDDYLVDYNFSLLYDDPKSKTINHEEMIQYLDENPIDHSVAMGFPWIDEKFALEQNEYLAEVKELTKGKILSFGTVPIDSGKSVYSLVKDIKGYGLSGIGEVGFYKDGMNDASEKYLRELFEAADEFALPVCLHVNEPVGHIYQGKYDPNLWQLFNIVKDFQNVKIIFAHWGGGLLFYELMKEVKESFKNFYYDTAASPYLYDEKIYSIALDIIGSERILFGSDYPLLGFKRYLDPISREIDSAEDRGNILGENAAGILGV